MDMKTYLSSVCHTSGFRFALPVKLGGAYFVKENQDRLGVSFESLGRGGSLVYTREVDLQLPVWALMSSRGISLDLTI